jgi:predicted nicotinamide N-methyase
MNSEEVPMKRPSMTAMFKNGAAHGLQNQKHKRLFESLQWRQAYLNAEYYEYELESSSVEIGSEPTPSLRAKQILNGEMKGLGTGTFVWPAAHVLAKYLEKSFGRNLVGKRVCDLGSGTGLVGLVAGLLGATVVLTDLEMLLPIMNENIEASKQLNTDINITAKVYDWNNPSSFDEKPFDILLISDCVLPKLYPIALLVEAVDYLLTPNTIALFSYEHRPFPEYDPRQEFRRLCLLKGLKVNIVPMKEHHPKYCAEDIEIWEVLRINSPLDLAQNEMNQRNNQQNNYAFQLLDWGEGKDIPFQLKNSVHVLKQFSSLGVGGAIWPSSVICSRKLMTKEFQSVLKKKLDSPAKVTLSLSPALKSGKNPENANPASFRGFTVLDLGAGCGLTSIVFHSLGFNVIATDKLAIMNLLEENVNQYLEQVEKKPEAVASSEDSSSSTASSKPFLKIIPFDWELENDAVKLYDNADIDLILCSDCLYNSMVVEPLIRVILMVRNYFVSFWGF